MCVFGKKCIGIWNVSRLSVKMSWLYLVVFLGEWREPGDVVSLTGGVQMLYILLVWVHSCFGFIKISRCCALKHPIYLLFIYLHVHYVYIWDRVLHYMCMLGKGAFSHGTWTSSLSLLAFILKSLVYSITYYYFMDKFGWSGSVSRGVWVWLARL